MGNDCFHSTPNQHYSKYLEKVNVSELKDLWSTTKLYKIKKIYQKASTQHPQHQNQDYLPFEQFKAIFHEFHQYQEMELRRIYQIFDYYSDGYVNWNGFYSAISICYFASQEVLAILIFMIFDHALTKQLTFPEISRIFRSNSMYLFHANQSESDDEINQKVSEIMENLSHLRPKVSVQQWIKESVKHIDYRKYKRFFQIFNEEREEKELVKNFIKWNTIYDANQISSSQITSYLVNYKWFESWKLYIRQYYNVTINVYSNDAAPTTCKTIKTQKVRSNKSIKYVGSVKSIASNKHATKKEISIKVLNKAESIAKQQFKAVQVQKAKDIDLVHHNIGDRPRLIYNNNLEGQFADILKPEISQNMDYVLVSEKVWKHLKSIYKCNAEFRRDGDDCIELYPKIVRIFSGIFKQQIDYSTEVIREVSSYARVISLLKSLDLSEEALFKKHIYFKTFHFERWVQLEELSYYFLELTAEIIICLMIVDANSIEEEQFLKNHVHKNGTNATQLNVCDDFIYIDPLSKQEKQAFFMGKNLEGKYIVHFSKISYIYDMCLLEEEVIKSCKLNNKVLVGEVKKAHCQIMSLPKYAGFGFMNCMFLHLMYNNKEFKNMLLLMVLKTPQNLKEGELEEQSHEHLITALSNLQHLLSLKKEIDPEDISDMVEAFLPDYKHFEVTKCSDFISDLMTTLSTQCKGLHLADVIASNYKTTIKKTISSSNCSCHADEVIQNYHVNVRIAESEVKYYTIYFVPSANNARYNEGEVTKFGFNLPKKCTLKEYMMAFEKIALLQQSKYILAEVFGNSIIKNYNTVNENATLQELCLRETDQIFAFELYYNFDQFISEHYTARSVTEEDDFKVNMFVDCFDSDKGWIPGKILEIQYLSTLHCTLVKVQHRFAKCQTWEVHYDAMENRLHSFPLKSYRNSEQYHLQVHQRYFNEVTNEMQLCSMPLVGVLTTWMRWRQFFYLIYLHVKPFIADQYQFQEFLLQNSKEEVSESKRKTQKPKDKKTIKLHEKQKLQKFKLYKNSKMFPYSLNLVDSEGRCAGCFKFLKSLVFKGQNESYCEGCQFSQQEPLLWQVNVSDLIICIDWKGLNYFKKNNVQEHPSYKNLTKTKNNQTDTLEQCLKLMNSYTIEEENLCCNIFSIKHVSQQIQESSEILPIFLERIIEENDGFKRVNHKKIEFKLENFEIKSIKYNLVGVISIEGDHKNIKYKFYCCRDDLKWLEFDEEVVRVVDKTVVSQTCALVLFYKKKK